MSNNLVKAIGILVCALVLAANASNISQAQAADLCNNTNTQGVRNNPSNHRTPCKLTQPAHITELVTYHWNNGLGAKPGKITLFNPGTGAQFGPFNAVGSPGQNGAANVNWTANVNIAVPAGNYQVIDSDFATWSWNSTSKNFGFAIVRGDYPSGGSPSTGSSACPQGAKGAAIGLLHCPCNYPVGWNTPTVNVTNPGLKKWYPACKPPLQCLGNHPGTNPFGDSSCQ